MALITVNTNGQTLTVNASVSYWATAALAVTASGTNDVESTTTTTITAATPLHFSNSATTALITVKQLDGTTLLSQTFNVEPSTGPRVLNPVPDIYQSSLDEQGPTGIVRPYLLLGGAVNVGVGGVNTTRFMRVVEGGTISKIRVYVGVQSGNIGVACYSNTGVGPAAAPGTQLITTGSIAAPATGVQDVSLGGSVTLSKGDWVGNGSDNDTGKFYGSIGVGLSTLVAGLAGLEAVFPPAATPVVTPADNRVIAFIGIP
jgi:hypothetical protein